MSKVTGYETEPCCANCIFWKQLVRDDEYRGICRRKPPLPRRRYDAMWPKTGPADWCGEFRRLGT